MNALDAVILGIIQGLTEFLPISSSGHLVLGKAILGIEESGLAFEIFVHFGTLLAVLFTFWNDVLKLLQAFFSLFHPKTYKIGIREIYQTDHYFRWFLYIVVATIPAVVIGLLFEDAIDTAFSDPHLASGMLLVTGVILLATYFCKSNGRPLGFGQSIAVGFAQAFAFLPGISRSGSTISTALYLGVDSDEAARFSFLLALPAIAGATILKIAYLLSVPAENGFVLTLTIGTVAAFISGYIAIKILLDIVRRGKLYWFAIYCFVIGGIGLLLT